jgi:hypothetical protein
MTKQYPSLKFILKLMAGLLILLLGFQYSAIGQDEMSQIETVQSDTIKIEKIDEHSPGLASLYSAVLPGLGQAYNGKHWKIPIVYGAFFTFGFLIYDNNIKYQYFRKNLIAELDNNSETINDTGRDAENLQSNRDNYRRSRDFNMIMLTITYFLQIADAHIDAHLLEFNVNQDITVSVDPALLQQTRNLAPGFSLKMNIR